LFVAFGVALIVVPLMVAPEFCRDVGGMAILLPSRVLGIALVGMGVVTPFCGTTLTFRRGEPTMEIRLSRITKSRTIFVPLARVAVELVVFGAPDAGRYTQTGVRLRLRGGDEPPVLVFCGRYSQARPLFQQLGTMLPEAVDRTCGTETSGNGPGRHDIEITRAPLGMNPGSFERVRGASDAPNVLVFRPAKKLWWASLLCLLVGSVALSLWAPMRWADDAAGVILVGVVGSIFLGLGFFAGYAAAFLRITVDMAREVIEVRRLMLGRRPRAIAFSDVYALQLCTRFARGGGDSSDSMTHELNLVLSQPADERVSLMSNVTVRPLREHAKQLGEIMGKPVLDHSNQDWPKMPENARRISRMMGLMPRDEAYRVELGVLLGLYLLVVAILAIYRIWSGTATP